jgi:hypothetical protein
MGAFLLGGIVGAAAVMYMNGSRPWSFAGLANRAGKSMNMGGGVKQANRSAAFASSNKSSADSKWSSAGLEDLESLINEDQTVKGKVDDIIHSSKHTSSGMTQ